MVEKKLSCLLEYNLVLCSNLDILHIKFFLIISAANRS